MTCSGATLDQGPEVNTGYGSGLQSGLTINVQAPASVTGTSIGIDVNNNNTINNLGTITTSGNDVWAINGGASLTVVNSGTIGNLNELTGINANDVGLMVTNNSGGIISGQSVAIQGAGFGGVGTATVINTGLIQSTSNTIDGGSGFIVVTNNFGGTITTDNGAAINNSVYSVKVTNSGTISTTVGLSGTAINAGDTATVINMATGIISADGNAITAPTILLTNAGSISANGSGASAVFGGNSVTVTNSGSIAGGTGAAAISMGAGSVTNNTGGTITGDSQGIIASSNTSVFNAGTITGSSGVAIAFTQGGGNTLTLGPGSVINGTAHGFGADTFQLGGTGTDTLNAGLFATQFSGYTTFNKIGASTWTLTGTGGAQAWNINAGTLVAGHQTAGVIDALGTGDITMNGGALRSTVTGTFNNNLVFNTNTSSVVSAATGQTVTFGPNGGASFVTFADNSVATFNSLTDTGTVVISSGFNNISASAQIVVAGGTLRDGNGTLGNATSFIASTTVNAGATLDMNDQADVIHNLLGSGTVIIGSSAATTLFLLSGDQLTGNFGSHLFAGVIQGPGSVEIAPVGAGGGETILTGTNTYTGGTFIQDTTILQLGNNTTTGSILGDVTFRPLGINGPGPGQLIFDRSNTYQFDGAISGPGNVVQAGAGKTILTAVNTYTGPTTISGGTLALSGNGSIQNSSQVNLTGAGATFDISAASGLAQIVTLNGVAGSHVNLGTNTLSISQGSTTYAGVIGESGGSGFVTIMSGTQTLAGVNTYTGGTNIVGGTLALSGGGSIASSSGVGLINANAVFDISGTTSGATIASLGGIAGSHVNVGAQTLTLSQASQTFNGIIGGSGGLALTGGQETLTGTNAYSGATAVSNATLVVNGSIASSLLTTVNANAALTGIGTVGATQINSGGMFVPGNGTPGTFMTVSGNLAFQSGALYLVQLNPATSTLAKVAGTATLTGASGAAFLPGSYVAKQYTILTANGGVSGTFNSFNTLGIPAGFKASLSYDAHDVFLDLAIGFTTPGGLNGNQQGIGNALNNFFNTTGGIPVVFGGLTPAGLTQLSGEVATGTQQATFDAMGLFMGLLTDPFVAGRGDGISSSAGATPFAEEIDAANAYAAKDPARSRSERDAYAAVYRKAPVMAPFVPSWRVWAAGFGGSQTTDGNVTLGSNNTTSRLGAVAVGADYRFSPNTIAGFALAGGGTSFSIANGLGSGRSDLFQAGAFVRHTIGPAYFTAALAYGWQDITTDRTVTIAGIDQLRARFNANAFSGRVEDGYRFAAPWMGLTPYAAGQFTTFDLPAYAERAIVGANTFALAYGAKSVTDFRSEVGLRTDKSWAMPDSIFTLRGRFAWAHDYNTDRSIGATFQTLPGASFVVGGAAQSPDKALTTASAEVKWRSGFSLAGTFEGEFSGNSRSYAGKGVARYAW